MACSKRDARDAGGGSGNRRKAVATRRQREMTKKKRRRYEAWRAGSNGGEANWYGGWAKGLGKAGGAGVTRGEAAWPALSLLAPYLRILNMSVIKKRLESMAAKGTLSATSQSSRAWRKACLAPACFTLTEKRAGGGEASENVANGAAEKSVGRRRSAPAAPPR